MAARQARHPATATALQGDAATTPIRHSRFAWTCMAVLVVVAAVFWGLDKRTAAVATLAGAGGCLGLILPPRERMPVLPWRLRQLPRRHDCAPVLATLLSAPGYGLNWFHGANPYDEIVHLLSGVLAGVVAGALLAADGRPRSRAARWGAGLVFGIVLAVGWEAFEWAVGILGPPRDTASDIVLTAGGAAVALVVAAGRVAPARPVPGARPG